MRFFLIIFFVIPLLSNAQTGKDTIDFQIIQGKYYEIKRDNYGCLFKGTVIGTSDTLAYKIDSIVFSTGNPKEEIHLYFIDKSIGFIYGNEMGYGIWPFLFKTTDGGKTWKRVLYKPKQYGSTITKDNFFMFNKHNGIIIDNADNAFRTIGGNTKRRFQYYITEDGGESWTLKKRIIKNSLNIRVINGYYFMQCLFKKNGEVTINILRPPWESAKGKREIKDRIRLVLTSNNFGNTFIEELIKE